MSTNKILVDDFNDDKRAKRKLGKVMLSLGTFSHVQNVQQAKLNLLTDKTCDIRNY